MSYESVASHRSMALDATRNRAYADALAQVVGPETVVLDLGAGTGVLGLIAARLGARHVYLVEPQEVLAVAGEVARHNGLADRVTCFQGRIQDLVLPERVDVIVSVMTGNFLVTEDLLGALFHARDRLLRPGGTLLPSEATMHVVPVSAPALHDGEVGAWSAPQHGVDLSPARVYAANTLFYKPQEARAAAWLAEPATMAALNFHEATDTNVHAETACTVTGGGLCHGWVGWFQIRLGDRWLSTSPREAPVHWSPVFLPIDPPLAVDTGEVLRLKIDRQAHGDWTWRMSAPGGQRRHSTLLSLPLSPASLRRSSRTYTPVLNAHGRIVAEILSRCDGSTTIDAIAEGVYHRHPDAFESAEAARRLVQHVVAPHA